MNINKEIYMNIYQILKYFYEFIFIEKISFKKAFFRCLLLKDIKIIKKGDIYEQK